LLEILTRVRERRISELPGFANLPKELLELKEVALSGSGEPTLCPDFPDALGEVIRIRAKGLLPFFKIVVITNTSGLPRPEVREALRSLGSRDEVWAKLDAGTQEYMDEINAPDAKLADVMSNILGLAAERPVVIQSLFPLVRGQEPESAEVDQYINRLRELKAGGAKISLVQIYSAHRPPRAGECDHLPLNRLSNIARRVRAATGLRAEVF
jgi:wyosine [tRNA(Phe)-imidazoG37] synthetase (radical SAM superfamily)